MRRINKFETKFMKGETYEVEPKYVEARLNKLGFKGTIDDLVYNAAAANRLRRSYKRFQRKFKEATLGKYKDNNGKLIAIRFTVYNYKPEAFA